MEGKGFSIPDVIKRKFGLRKVNLVMLLDIGFYQPEGM